MDGVVGGWGGAPHTCAHAHVCTCTHMHAWVNMIISCKWPPPVGESLGKPYDVICAMCMCVHVCHRLEYRREHSMVQWKLLSLFLYLFCDKKFGR